MSEIVVHRVVTQGGNPRIFGLTGGIASGKSTVARMFADLGAAVVDADLLARQVVEPGQPALRQIAETFGEHMLDEEGKLRRKRLGALVFGDADARAALNAIVHPRIAAAGQAAIAAHVAAGHHIVLYEAALIVENKLSSWMAGLIVVSVPEALQRTRLMERDELDQAEADARLSSQAPLAEKLAAADYVIDNSHSAEDTRRQVVKLWNTLTGHASQEATSE